MNKVTADLVMEACALLKARRLSELVQKYRSMGYTLVVGFGDWRPGRSDRSFNLVRALMEKVDARDLSDEHDMYRSQILWMWHYAAAKYSVDVLGDKALARHHALQAFLLNRHFKSEPKTHLLYYLVNGQIDRAERFAAGRDSHHQILHAFRLIDAFIRADPFGDREEEYDT